MSAASLGAANYKYTAYQLIQRLHFDASEGYALRWLLSTRVFEVLKKECLYPELGMSAYTLMGIRLMVLDKVNDDYIALIDLHTDKVLEA